MLTNLRQLARFAFSSAGLVSTIGLSYLYFSHAYPFVSDYVNGFKAPDIFDIAAVFFMLAVYGFLAGLVLWILRRALLGGSGNNGSWRTVHRHESHRS